ncbi:MAG: CvpA family protein [Candidatus Limimorpha sp.]
MEINYLDVVLGITLLLFGIGGLRKGFIIETSSLLGFVVGVYGALHFSDFTAAKLSTQFDIPPAYLNAVAFLLTFFILAVIVNLIGKLLSKVVKEINLGAFDKIGGFVFGALKGLLLCSLLIMVLNAFHLNGTIREETKSRSMIYPFVERTVPYVYRGFDLVKAAVEQGIDVNSDGDCDSDEMPETEEPVADENTVDV